MKATASGVSPSPCELYCPIALPDGSVRGAIHVSGGVTRATRCGDAAFSAAEGDTLTGLGRHIGALLDAHSPRSAPAAPKPARTRRV